MLMLNIYAQSKYHHITEYDNIHEAIFGDMHPFPITINHDNGDMIP